MGDDELSRGCSERSEAQGCINVTAAHHIISCHALCKDPHTGKRQGERRQNGIQGLMSAPQSIFGPSASHWLVAGGGEPNPPAGGGASASAQRVLAPSASTAITISGCGCRRSARSGALRPTIDALHWRRSPSCRALLVPLVQGCNPSAFVGFSLLFHRQVRSAEALRSGTSHNCPAY